MNDYISVPNSTSLNITGTAITLSGWIKPSSSGTTQVIISKIAATGTHDYPYFAYNLQLHYQNSVLYPRFWLTVGGTTYYAANTSYSITLNQWYHLVGTFDGTTMRLYVNGTEVATTAASGNITGFNTPLYFGVNGALGEAFGGIIDEVGIWNRALSSSEISQLYNSGSGLAYPFCTTNYTLTTNVTPASSGTVSLSPSGGSYSSGTTVTLTATASSGYTFSGWSGDLSGSVNPATLVMSANKSVTAIFTSTSGGSDNLGNHTATQNILLNNFWLSNNGDNVGLRINNNGDIGIGTATPGYKLDVIGTVRAREIKVDLSGADFVFEKNYKLMPLSDLEEFVNENKHLPEIPAAADMQANGTDLGYLNTKLLQKIEELTLYIIEQNKRIGYLENMLKNQ